MSIRVYVVDAFADRPFEGNPAAVCLLPRAADETWMKHLAREMNLSETAFLHPEGDGFRLRWLTPEVEVDLCGHATLASAHILREQGLASSDATIVFHTRSGRLTAAGEGDAIVLDFPAKPVERPADPSLVAAALGASPVSAWWNAFDLLVELDSEATVRALRPDFGGLARVEARGIIVTARATDPALDFVSRFFAPASGIDEDPVTGSAHCCLGPYWGARLGRDELVGRQVSARGGTVRVRLRGDRVDLIGRAVTISEVTLIGAAARAF
ncbi:MAG: PhzF family phenazine biosynthesis protein [Isosphaeraceae bacterium]|nr:PhzF family phenazine biosynthesis protein [Isosphaeraceae bacterium]